MAFAVVLLTDNRFLYPIHLSKNDLQLVAATCKKLSVFIFQRENGGGERARTDDLLRAKQVLSQLSYTPKDEFRILEFGSVSNNRRSLQLSTLYPHSETRNQNWWA